VGQSEREIKINSGNTVKDVGRRLKSGTCDHGIRGVRSCAINK
jgi:hypothetical protein